MWNSVVWNESCDVLKSQKSRFYGVINTWNGAVYVTTNMGQNFNALYVMIHWILLFRLGNIWENCKYLKQNAIFIQMQFLGLQWTRTNQNPYKLSFWKWICTLAGLNYILHVMSNLITSLHVFMSSDSNLLSFVII